MTLDLECHETVNLIPKIRFWCYLVKTKDTKLVVYHIKAYHMKTLKIYKRKVGVAVEGGHIT